MAIDDDLRTALRDRLTAMDDIDERAMFGGVGFMWRGNLLCGVMGHELLVRIGKEAAEDLIEEDGAHPMVMGGRTSKGWILVPVPGDRRGKVLTRWVNRAIEYVATLPAK